VNFILAQASACDYNEIYLSQIIARILNYKVTSGRLRQIGGDVNYRVTISSPGNDPVSTVEQVGYQTEDTIYAI
jgi:hypothetical protein